MDPNDIFAATNLQQDIANATYGNDLTAAVRTGYRFFTGLAGKRDVNQARFYFGLGAQGSTATSPWIQYLSFWDSALHGVALPSGTFGALVSLANTGDPIAQTLLGRVQEVGWSGSGTNVSAAKAAYLAVGSEFALAQTLLGEMSLRAGDINGAQLLFQQASTKSDTRAMVNLALIYACKSRVLEAKQLLNAAVLQNNCRAMYRLGLLYRVGVGGAPPNLELAVGLFGRAAKMGYPFAMALVGNGYAKRIVRRRVELASIRTRSKPPGRGRWL